MQVGKFEKWMINKILNEGEGKLVQMVQGGKILKGVLGESRVKFGGHIQWKAMQGNGDFFLVDSQEIISGKAQVIW